MKRRNFIRSIAALFAVPMATNAEVKRQQLRATQLQSSPVAGVQYYQIDQAWTKLKKGDRVLLQLEPDNQYDKDAVEIYWQDHDRRQTLKLGYLPRKQNYAVSQLLKQQQLLISKITDLKESDDPWQRIQIAVFLQG